MQRIRLADLAERLVWTFVAGFIGALIASGVLDLGLALWQSAALAGLADIATLLLVVARRRLRVLPDPGDGLPGLRADAAGRSTDSGNPPLNDNVLSGYRDDA